MMVLISYFFLVPFLGDLGFMFFLVLFLVLSFHLVFSLTVGVLTLDCVSYGFFLLVIMVFLLMVLAGWFECASMNSWLDVLVLLFVLSVSLFYLFGVSTLLVFYLVFELCVLPVFVVMLGWGYSPFRFQSAVYMFFYTFLSALPMLYFLLKAYFFNLSLTFYLSVYLMAGGSFVSYWWFIFVGVFLVKLPLFVLHLWLPSAHVDAPLLGSMVLAGVLLKLGGYGLYKTFVFYYGYAFGFSHGVVVFSMYGAFFMSIITLRQLDIKSMVAYSSVVHMGAVASCIFSSFHIGLLGSYWVMLSHGLSSPMLFFLVNFFYQFINSRSSFVIRGTMFFLPVLSYIWFFFCVVNMGFPPSFAFFSELFSMVSLFVFSKYIMCLFFFLMLFVGFYSVLLYLFFNHGYFKLWCFGYSGFNLKHFLSCFVSLVVLFLILVFFILLSC